MGAGAMFFFAIETLQTAGFLVDFGLAFAPRFVFVFEELLRAAFFFFALLVGRFGFRAGGGWFGGLRWGLGWHGVQTPGSDWDVLLLV